MNREYYMRGVRNGHKRGMTPEEVAHNMRCKIEFVKDNWPKDKPRAVSDVPEDTVVPIKPKKKKSKKK